MEFVEYLPPTQSSSHILRRAKPLLGTIVSIEIETSSKELGGAANLVIDTAFERIARVNDLMSPVYPESDVVCLNSLAVGQAMTVHPWTYQVLEAALTFFEASEGAFFPCADLGNISTRIFPVSLEDNFLVRRKIDVELSLGGIAKGFAVDLAFEIITERIDDLNLSMIKINAGGDMRIWTQGVEPIHVRNPNNPSEIFLLTHIRHGAVATSGNYFREQPHLEPIVNDGKKILSATVIAVDATTADALTKILWYQRQHACLKRFEACGFIMSSDSNGIITIEQVM